MRFLGSCRGRVRIALVIQQEAGFKVEGISHQLSPAGSRIQSLLGEVVLKLPLREAVILHSQAGKPRLLQSSLEVIKRSGPPKSEILAVLNYAQCNPTAVTSCSVTSV